VAYSVNVRLPHIQRWGGPYWPKNFFRTSPFPIDGLEVVPPRVSNKCCLRVMVVAVQWQTATWKDYLAMTAPETFMGKAKPFPHLDLGAC